MTLGARLIILILLAAVPVFLIHLVSDYELREARKASVTQGAETLARLVAARQDRIVEGARLLLEASSHLQSVREKNSEACNRRFRDISAKVQELTAMAVLANSRTCCRSFHENDVLDYHHRARCNALSKSNLCSAHPSTDYLAFHLVDLNAQPFDFTIQ